MKIVKVEHHSSEELVANLRNVVMLTDRKARPYANADIALWHISTDRLDPAQRYALNSEVKKVRDLKWALAEHGADLYRLHGYVTIWLEGSKEPIDVLPPIVEVSKEADGFTARIINDGLHRCYLARMERSHIQVAIINDIPEEYPYYAYPLVDGWSGVELRDDIPETYIKKWHRIKNYKTLYRDFNSGGFQNVGGPRGNFTNGGK